MALEADAERLVLVQGSKRAEANVLQVSRSGGKLLRFPVSRGNGHELHVSLRGAVTRLAVDRERRHTRIPFFRHAVEADVDLTPMTSLAIGEAGLVAQYALRRPVTAVGESDVGGDGDPPLVQPRLGVAEPRGRLAAPVEGEQAPGSVGETRDERLRPAAHHVPATDDPIDREAALRPALLPNGERIAATRAGDHDRIAKADRRLVEGRDDLDAAGRPPGGAMRRSAPGRVLCLVTGCAAVRSRKVGED